jgi:hypothetical protein
MSREITPRPEGSVLEEKLKLALRREEPPAEFADRVMSRIARLPEEIKQEKPGENAGLAGARDEVKSWRQKLLAIFEFPQLKWAMAGAMAAALLIAGFGVYRNRENERQRMLAEIADGELAKEQVILAMRIASEKLNVAQRKINETGEREPQVETGERQ